MLGRLTFTALPEAVAQNHGYSSLNWVPKQTVPSDSTWMGFDYYTSVARFRLYELGYRKDWQAYRNDVIHHDRNLQHYKNNLFLMREREFSRMMNEPDYWLTKATLVTINNFLTGGGTQERFPNPSLMLKTENKLVVNNALNLLHQTFGSQTVDVPSGWIALDIHVHTYNSFDASSDVERLLLTASEKGFGALAITDHDYFDDAQTALRTAARLKKEGSLPPDFVVIPGMEISSFDGHILGLFLKSYIPHGMTAEQTIKAIHEQGGLAIAPHPFQPNFGLGPKLVKSLKLDGMVVTGIGMEFQLSVKLAEEVQDSMAIFMDSDTHVESGLAWMGYTLVQTTERSADGIYQAIKSKKTKPVHRNIMSTQSKLSTTKFARIVRTPLAKAYEIRMRLEGQMAKLLLANRVHIHSAVSDISQDILDFNFFNPGYEKFLGGNMDKRLPISGLSVYYGPVHLNMSNEQKNRNVALGMKLSW